MQVTETSAEGLKREFKITVPASEVEEKVSRRLGEIGRSVRIPGFRPGKVPMQLLRKRYGPAVRGEVLESTVQGSSAEAMREQNLRPALPPRVEIVSAAEGADLEYKMSVELLPDMPEPDFGDLGIERLVAEVPEEDIDRAVERIAESQRKAEPVERPAENGDIVVVDFVGRTGDVEFPGGKGEDVSIELGAGRFIPGFEDQIIGAKAGEDRTVNVTFPADYGAPDLAGKEAVFEVKVKEVRERQPAAIDDSLAEAVGLTPPRRSRRRKRRSKALPTGRRPAPRPRSPSLVSPKPGTTPSRIRARPRSRSMRRRSSRRRRPRWKAPPTANRPPPRTRRMRRPRRNTGGLPSGGARPGGWLPQAGARNKITGTRGGAKQA